MKLRPAVRSQSRAGARVFIHLRNEGLEARGVTTYFNRRTDLIALFMMLGLMARPGGPPLLESLLAAVLVSFVAVGLLIRELWLAAAVGGITAAATTVVFARVFPGSETRADPAR